MMIRDSKIRATCLATLMWVAGPSCVAPSEGPAGQPPLGDAAPSLPDATSLPEADPPDAPEPMPPGLPDPPPSCEPAGCMGGPKTEPPHWGCPDECAPACLGDRVCCGDGTCLPRDFMECVEGCAVEPTIALYSPWGVLDPWVKVCNRGSEEADARDWRVLLTVEGETLLELAVARTLQSCECAWFSFEIPVEFWTVYAGWAIAVVDATLIADDEGCGSPTGRVDVLGFGSSGDP